MSDYLDKKLSTKIKESFEEHEETFDDALWKNMEERLDQKKRKRIIPWFWLKAASVILFIGLTSFYLYDKKVDFQVNITVKNDNVLEEENKNLLVNKKSIAENTNSKKEIKLDKKELVKETNSKKSIANNINPKREIKIEETKFLKENISKKSIAKTKEIESEKLKTNYLKNHNLEQENTVGKIAFLESRKIKNIPINQKNIFIENREIQEIEDYQMIVLKEKEEKKKENSFDFNIDVSSAFSQSTENKDFAGYLISGGLVTKYRITENLKFNTGVVFSQEKIFQNKEEKSDYQSHNNANNSFSNIESINLAAIDLPLNMEYGFNLTKRKKAFVSLGVSSFYYLSQKMDKTFYKTTNTSVFNSVTNQYITQTNTVKSNRIESAKAENFEFAKVANLSIGFLFPMKNRRGAFVLEPFAKIPIGKRNLNEATSFSVGMRLQYRLGK